MSRLSRLHFSENYGNDFSSGKRLFSVSINSVQVLNNFDIYMTAASQYRAIIEEFNARANTSGQIAVAFTDGSADHAKIDGIEIASVAPAPPASLSATAANGQIALQCAASADATSYNIKRAAISGGPYALIASTGIANYTYSPGVGGVSYYYVVSAVSSGGQSANSGEAGAALPAPQLSAVVGGASNLRLSWPAWAAGYQLYAATNLAAPIQWQVATNPVQSSNGTSWVDLSTTNRPRQFFRLSTQ